MRGANVAHTFENFLKKTRCNKSAKNADSEAVFSVPKIAKKPTFFKKFSEKRETSNAKMNNTLQHSNL
jgi:hypothetical protein